MHVAVYRGVPEEHAFTAFTAGLSHFHPPDGGHKELTTRMRDADIAWAMAYHLEGTPLVLINGKEALPVGPFLYGLAMSGGDANSKLFSKLPQR